MNIKEVPVTLAGLITHPTGFKTRRLREYYDGRRSVQNGDTEQLKPAPPLTLTDLETAFPRGNWKQE